jgi:threonine synthase
VSTSSGFKDKAMGTHPTAPVTPEWVQVERRLRAAGITG